MCANWTRSSGRASALAPESRRTEGPRRAGIVTAIAGLRTPGMRRISSRQAASIAPVLPAETTAPAFPSRTARHAMTSELFGFARTASVGFSSIVITSGASISSSPCVSRPAGPTSRGATSSERAASAPATISSAPRSPPIASTATRITGYGAGVRSGSTSRPRYVWHVGQTRCGRFGRPHWGQMFRRGASILCCARRLSRRALEVFFLGTAMGRRSLAGTVAYRWAARLGKGLDERRGRIR